ncbi:unnamed protein product [Effrenium voratum]|uniref:t-SNARE coiled-coil homology domain-containing protein n=1 Tax=Effrenium voratum TaxID=2562239 RepID=A0AA36JK12_9DINO|nr:unnamed protein product [Effrenium voratum]
MDVNALQRLSADARTLSEATDQVASLIQQQGTTFDAVEEQVGQTVEETRGVVDSLSEVAIGKSRSRVAKVTIAVGACGAAVGCVPNFRTSTRAKPKMFSDVPLLGTSESAVTWYIKHGTSTDS